MLFSIVGGREDFMRDSGKLYDRGQSGELIGASPSACSAIYVVKIRTVVQLNQLLGKPNHCVTLRFIFRSFKYCVLPLLTQRVHVKFIEFLTSAIYTAPVKLITELAFLDLCPITFIKNEIFSPIRTPQQLPRFSLAVCRFCAQSL